MKAEINFTNESLEEALTELDPFAYLFEEAKREKARLIDRLREARALYLPRGGVSQ